MPPKRSRSGNHPQPVSRLLKPGKGGMGQLLAQARQLAALDVQLAGLVDKEIAALVQVAALRDTCLVLVTPSAALATRLRMDSESLVRSMSAASGKPISELKVRVAPLAHLQTQARRHRGLPEPAKQSLRRFAEDCGDADIRKKLQGESDSGDG